MPREQGVKMRNKRESKRSWFFLLPTEALVRISTPGETTEETAQSERSLNMKTMHLPATKDRDRDGVLAAEVASAGLQPEDWCASHIIPTTTHPRERYQIWNSWFECGKYLKKNHRVEKTKKRIPLCV
mmetsp:Transcript_17420/g.44361  ORF Transcript_17420/g.44361 Transcript_17420/m.44361 type:complete len:128 (+) Transcript_17420:746-1129(+)